VDLSTDKLPAGSVLAFTFYWLEAEREEGRNFSVTIEQGAFEEPKRTDLPAQASAPHPSENGGNATQTNGKRTGRAECEARTH
ncbi:MAG TPA: hypothetical protein VIK18_14600, partial [Pirellulales bacterium]